MGYNSLERPPNGLKHVWVPQVGQGHFRGKYYLTDFRPIVDALWSTHTRRPKPVIDLCSGHSAGMKPPKVQVAWEKVPPEPQLGLAQDTAISPPVLDAVA